MVRKYDLVLRPHEGTGDEFEDIVRSIAERDVGGCQPVVPGQPLLQREAVAIRVAGNIIERGARRFQCALPGPEWILVAGQLDDVANTVLAFKLLNGLARHIGRKRAHPGTRQRQPAVAILDGLGGTDHVRLSQ